MEGGLALMWFRVLLWVCGLALVLSQDFTTGSKPSATVEILLKHTKVPLEGGSVTLDCVILSDQRPDNVVWSRRGSTQKSKRSLDEHGCNTILTESRYSGKLQVVDSTADCYSYKITIDPVKQLDKGFYWCYAEKGDEVIAISEEHNLDVYHPDDPVCSPSGQAKVAVGSVLSCMVASDTRTAVVSEKDIPKVDTKWIGNVQEFNKMVTNLDHNKTFFCYSINFATPKVPNKDCLIGPLTVFPDNTDAPTTETNKPEKTIPTVDTTTPTIETSEEDSTTTENTTTPTTVTSGEDSTTTENTTTPTTVTFGEDSTTTENTTPTTVTSGKENKPPLTAPPVPPFFTKITDFIITIVILLITVILLIAIILLFLCCRYDPRRWQQLRGIPSHSYNDNSWFGYEFPATTPTPSTTSTPPETFEQLRGVIRRSSTTRQEYNRYSNGPSEAYEVSSTMIATPNTTSTPPEQLRGIIRQSSTTRQVNNRNGNDPWEGYELPSAMTVTSGTMSSPPETAGQVNHYQNL
ncbi:uncharacterized protein [Asterias amurensis]|uniref:uncharacterized protein n=1 Tax=Asterias amurensis TaxID=7602 RepID=UPI003AB604D2